MGIKNAKYVRLKPSRVRFLAIYPRHKNLVKYPVLIYAIPRKADVKKMFTHLLVKHKMDKDSVQSVFIFQTINRLMIFDRNKPNEYNDLAKELPKIENKIKEQNEKDERGVE